MISAKKLVFYSLQLFYLNRFIEIELTEKYQKELISCHADSCSWRLTSCSEDICIYKQERAEFFSEFNDLTQQWLSLLLPELHMELPLELKILEKTPEILAITGWKPKSGCNNVAECCLGCGSAMISEGFDPVNSHRWFCPFVITLPNQDPSWLTRSRQQQGQVRLQKNTSFESLLSRHTLGEVSELLKK